MKRPKLTAIAAMGKSRQIGIDGTLPWKIPEEYEHYQNTAGGHYLIVGRKNYEANASDIKIGTPLVLTRQKDYSPKGVRVFHSFEEVLSFLKDQNCEQAFVIGGEEIYRLSLPFLDEILLSVVDYDGEADTYFPELNETDWNVKVEKRPKYELRRMTKKLVV